MGRGVSIEDWESAEGLDQLKKWATLDLGEIAKRMGITRTTLSRWCKKSDAIRAVLYDREMCEAVEKEMYKICFERRYVVKQKKQVFDKNGEIKVLEEEKEVVLPADFRAQKYWMNNRNPDRWKDKVEVAVDATSGGMITLPVAELRDPDEDEGADG